MRHRRPATPAGHRAAPPEERSLTDPRFLGSFPRADVPLDPPLPEIALLGRSNVGKSTLLNALVRRRIARVSATPGKTTMLNVYQAELGRGEGGGVAAADAGEFPSPGHRPLPPPSSLYLLDLPGYGYARASKGDRSAFRILVEGTLRRPSLSGVLWLLDIRRDLSREDGEIRELLAATGLATLAALTKGDKLPQQAGTRRETELRAALEFDEDQLVVTSARTGAGMDELREAITGLIGKAAA